MSTSLVQSLTNAELSFAQQLASGDTTVRRKAVVKLTKWFNSTLKHNEMTRTDFMRLWKGLYYCLWMQDKMLLQEQLVDTICALLPSCGTTEKCLLYAETCYETVAVEWPGIDKFRIDKFMMIVRRILRASLAYVRDSHKWSVAVVAQLINGWKSCLVSSSGSIPAGLKYHFASVLLDELDLAHTAERPITKSMVGTMLMPFIQLYGVKQCKDQYITTISGEIFDTLLMPLAAGHHLPMEQDESDESGDESNAGSTGGAGKVNEEEDANNLQFDYAALGAALMAIGRQTSITANRRRKVYELVNKFQLAADGKDPFAKGEDEMDVEEEEAEGDCIERAANRLLRREEAARLLMERGTHPLAKPDKKKRGLGSKMVPKEVVVDSDDSDDSDDIIEMGENELSMSSDSDGEVEEKPKKKKKLTKKLKSGEKSLKAKKTITKTTITKKAITKKTKSPSKQPKESTKPSKESSEKPKAASKKPKRSIEKPKESSEKRAKVSKKSKGVASKKPKSGTEKPTETIEKPKTAASKKPKSATETPKSATKKPKSATKKPKSATIKPTETIEKPKALASKKSTAAASKKPKDATEKPKEARKRPTVASKMPKGTIKKSKVTQK